MIRVHPKTSGLHHMQAQTLNSTPVRKKVKQDRNRRAAWARFKLAKRFWISAALSTSRTSFVPQTLRTTSPRPLPLYRTATRRRETSPNSVPRRSTRGLSVKITDNFKGNDLTAYIETDFSGNDASNVYQSVNGTTNRLRLYFADFKRGKWEFLGGQTWSWLTPNRNGIGPMPIDLALTYNEDQNLSVGVPYTRAAEFRVAYHPNEHWAMGVGIEDPNQYIGGYVALPTGFTSIGPQFDNGAQIGAANAFPDILSKITYDRDFSGRHFHAEVTGLFTGAHASVMPIGSTSFKTHTVVGGGGQIAANYELLPKLTVLANAFWSDGGAHYLVGTGPQLVVRPNAAGTDVNLSMVHAGAGSAGLEWRATPKDAFAVYYAADYFGRNFFPDTTDTAHPGTIIGYGGPGSPNTNNRSYSAGHIRLDHNLLEKSNLRSAADLHPVFLPDTCPLVCSSRRSQECASQHGLLRSPLRSADHVRHAAPRASSGLERRHVETQEMASRLRRQLCSLFYSAPTVFSHRAHPLRLIIRGIRLLKSMSKQTPGILRIPCSLSTRPRPIHYRS